MKLISIVLICLFYFLIITHNIYASTNIVINEFSSSTSNNDWIELYNPTNIDIDIIGLTIQDTTSSSKEAKFHEFEQSTIVPSFGFCIVNCGNRLNSDGDRIRLLYKEEVIDCVSYGNGNGVFCKDFADLGSPLGNLTGSRKPDGSDNWAFNQPTQGYSNLTDTEPSEKKLCYVPTPVPSPTPLPTPTSIPDITPTAVATITSEPTHLNLLSYDNIYISEVMVNPQTGESEWVELYNANDFNVVLTNWYIDDIENGGSSPKQFSLEIGPKSYNSFNLASSMFNNDSDSVRLLDFNKSLKDDFEYSFSEKGKTLARTSFENDEFCLQEQTKGVSNGQCLDPTAKPTPKPTSTTNITSTKTAPTAKPLAYEKENSKASNIPFITNSNYFFSSQEQKMGEVLGVMERKNNHYLPLLRSLTFASFAFSLLTILSFSLRIYKRVLSA